MDAWPMSNLVEEYDPATNSWKIIHQMNLKRANHVLFGFQSKLWAIGGTDQPNFAEMYDPERDTWSMVSELGHFTKDLIHCFPIS